MRFRSGAECCRRWALRHYDGEWCSTADVPAPGTGWAAKLAERLPVNVVFLGYGRPGEHRDAPGGAAGEVRAGGAEPASYGIKEPLGINSTYDYKVSVADSAYQNRFFAQLKQLAKPAPLTLFQTDYNAQEGNSARTSQQPPHRRAERREVARDQPTERASTPPQHGLPD